MEKKLSSDITSFSIRKIPVSTQNKENILTDNYFDKIKILELSNIIDEWEKEILFSENGFYSLKGKEIENKTDEFALELNNFISEKISEIKFEDSSSKIIANKIKEDKVNAIKVQMQLYEQQELSSWQIETYENAITSSISRAVLYKSNDNVISSSFQNGLSVLKLMSEKENWNSKIFNYREEQYKSEFYYSIIKSFIEDKDANAYRLFEKYKDSLFIEEKEKLETLIKELKVNVVAYNWAKELFSYNLSKKEQEKEINNIKDSDIENAVRRYLSDFSTSKKKEKERKEKDDNIKNWQEINEIITQDVNKAYLYIDFSLNNESIKNKKDYIKQIQKNGYISTDKKQFINLLTEVFEDIDKYKEKDISNYQHCFSTDDYNFFVNLQKIENSEFYKLTSDYEYAMKIIQNINLKNDEDKYMFINLVIASISEYKKINDKEADIKERNKIIEAITERFKKEGK